MESEENKKPELELEDGRVEMTPQQVNILFYLLVKQNQELHPGSKMSFPLQVFKNLPKELAIHFERKHGRLFAWIPSKRKDRERKSSNIYIPKNKIITPN